MVILNLRAVGVASWLSALYEPIFLTKILPRCYIPCVDGWLQIFVVGLHSTIEESLRNILRKSVSKVSRRYFIQGTTLVGVCRDAEMESDDSRETSSHHGRGYKRRWLSDKSVWSCEVVKCSGARKLQVLSPAWREFEWILEWLVIKPFIL